MTNQSSNLLDALVSANDGAVVRQIAGSLGLPDEAVVNAARQMLPALAGGIQRNLGQDGGTDSLMRALQSGEHERYLQDPQLLAQPASVDDGNAILGHILGDKDVSRNVAGFASQQTGIDAALLQKMLPMLATAAMGILAAKTAQTGTPGINPDAPSGGSLTDVLGGLLGHNQGDSPVNDLLNLAQRFFHRPR